MSYNLKFAVKNLITNEDILVEDGIINYPIFNVEQYKIRVYFPNSSSYTRVYRKAVRWDFGDGTVIEGAAAEHSYKKSGSFTIRCTFYNIDRKPVENEYTVKVYVKEVIPIKLSFVNPLEISKKELTIGKITKLLTLESSVGANVKTLAPIVCNRISNKDEKSYFDINKKELYHLEKYYTFLKENISTSFKKDVADKITLSPTKYYVPTYTPVYVKFENNNGKINARLFVYIENEKTAIPEKYEMVDPNTSALEDDVSYISLPLERITKRADLAGSEHCGWIALVNIWYKDDYNSVKDLYFSYDSKYFEFYNESIDINAINIPPIGLTADVKLPAESDLIYALTPLGLLGDEADNIDIEKDKIIIEKHLYHNFYIDYKVSGYFAQYIKNDSPDGSISWSIIKNNSLVLPDLMAINCTLESAKSFDYIKKYYFTPQGSTFELRFKDINNKDHSLKLNDIKALYSIMIPEKNYKYINFQGVLDAYMPHIMFEDAVNLKEFLTQLFETNNLFENINNKGFDFFDDIVNHKTCYISYLQSILQMFGSDEMVYNINSFDKINELRDLVRILSMQYCDLFGQFTQGELDIKINNDLHGLSVGDRILPTDVIAADSSNNIIAIIRDNEIYSTGIATKSIILYDNFTKESRLINFDNAASSGEHPLHKEFVKRGYYINNYYSLNDYHYSWNWNLQLPEEANTSINRAKIIDSCYSFYICVPNSDNSDFKHNYLDKTTFPYVNNYLITPEEWYRDFSHTYDCLMKVLIYKLGLS